LGVPGTEERIETRTRQSPRTYEVLGGSRTPKETKTMAKLHRWSVKGNGPFPLDMLRYDSCWPLTSYDVELMAGNVKVEEPTEVHMVSLSGPPTTGRWESFGWTVGDVSSTKI
jgi:hypothetical protein